MGKIKILYMDSQKEFAKNALNFFIENNYDLKYINSIKKAHIEYSFNKPDIIITDIDLEDGNALNFIKKIKKLDNQIKLIILSSNTHKDILLEALKLKVDKFIIKDKDFYELQQEINNLKIHSDREENHEKIIYDLGKEYLYENDTFKIVYNKKIIHLTSQENDLISELLKAQGNFVPYETLQNCIGKAIESTIDTLRTVIRKIRKKTYNDIIQNKNGFGYKINLQKNIDLNSNIKISNYTKIDAKILILKGDKKQSELLEHHLRKLGFDCELLLPSHRQLNL
ncbi:MAG: response regulator [Campylobacterota bacterium]|nr:response regulator [Campylobacterota bacterium]